MARRRVRRAGQLRGHRPGRSLPCHRLRQLLGRRTVGHDVSGAPLDHPRRCTAHRQDWKPCRRYAIRGGNVCRVPTSGPMSIHGRKTFVRVKIDTRGWGERTPRNSCRSGLTGNKFGLRHVRGSGHRRGTGRTGPQMFAELCAGPYGAGDGNRTRV